MNEANVKTQDPKINKETLYKQTKAEHKDTRMNIEAAEKLFAGNAQSNKPIINMDPQQFEGETIDVHHLDLFYDEFQALKDVSMMIPEKRVTAFIGPSGCGKSTFLRCFNRMNDLIDNCRIEGEIQMHGANILSKDTDVVALRTKVGMVFQSPNPFPMSIYDNVAYGLRCQGVKDKRLIDERVEASLRAAALWNEVKDHLHRSGTSMSGGQQQRLVIARAIALKPEVILMDEPTSALDPLATSKIEDLIMELKGDYTIIIVTHSMAQAARVSDRTAFFLLGEVIEYGETDKIFHNPEDERTEAYISGKFG